MVKCSAGNCKEQKDAHGKKTSKNFMNQEHGKLLATSIENIFMRIAKLIFEVHLNRNDEIT
jgi:hypothetical protein